MSIKQPKKSRAEILAILADVALPNRTFELLDKGDGYLLRMTYNEACVITGKTELQKTRKWYISGYANESEIVETAYACAVRSAIHVVSEHFTYKGRRVYSPHFDIHRRMSACDDGAYDARLPAPVPAKRGRPPGEHQAVLSHYMLVYERETGSKPIITSRTGKAAKDLIKAMSLDEVCATIDKAFQDKWFVENSKELHFIAANANKYHSKPEKQLPLARPAMVPQDALDQEGAKKALNALRSNLFKTGDGENV